MMTFRPDLSRFLRNEDGTATVEMLISLPVLLTAFTMGYQYYDAYRAKTVAQRATYSIADLLSRQTEAIDAAYLEGVFEVFQFLSNTDDDTARMRVTSVTVNKKGTKYKRNWSYATSGQNLNNERTREMAEKLPVIAFGDTVILVETWTEYEAMFAAVLEPVTFRGFVTTRPRFAPQLAWDNGN